MQNLNNQHTVFNEQQVDFQDYIELPNNNPLVIVDYRYKVVYRNSAFKSNFTLKDWEDISLLDSSPDFSQIIKGFSESKYKNISIDINLSNLNDPFVKSYSLKIERIQIRSNQYFVLIIESLEQRKKLENKIYSLHNALEQSNLPIIVLDSAGRVNFATKSFEEILSKEIEAIYHQPLVNYLDIVLSHDLKESFRLAIENFQRWKRVILINRKLENEYWEFVLNPAGIGDESHPSFILVANNLTEHINQTKAVERSEKKQKLIINNISDLLLIVERCGTPVLFENANDNFCRIFEIERNKVFSLKIEDFLPKRLVDEIGNSTRLLSQSHLPYNGFMYRHTDGRKYACKITSITEIERNSTIFVITMKDVTEEEMYREQLKRAYHKELQLNKMKLDFLANMSHEIRTPFNAVVGYSEIIRESYESGDIESLRDLMESMKEVLGRALNLFTNIIEVSQIEAGEIELEKVDLNCNAIVRNVYERSASEAEKKKLEYLLDLTQEDCLIEVDWVKFEKIIQSIVDNSIKYTNSGTVYLKTELIGNDVEIIVADTGVGIESIHINRLLEPFTQEIEGYTRPFEGAGLGLTIANKLTKLMGGEFLISSQKDKGSKVTIKFPLSKS